MSDRLLDSDVIIEVLRGSAKVHTYLEHSHRAGRVIHYTAVNLAEIFHGIRPREEVAVREFFGQLLCLPLTRAVGERAGRYLATYHASHGLRLGDALPAACAVEYDCVLATLNVRHYPMTDLKLERPE